VSARSLLLVLAVGAVLAAGCEEERRAWVSILPAGDDEEEAAPEPRPGGPLGVSEDGRAVLLGEDTLFTADRLPSRARTAVGLQPLRFRYVVFSPDSSRVAFSTTGANEAVGVWSRTGQTGLFLDVFTGGRVDSLAWAPEGRLLAWGGRSSEAISRVSIADPAGRRLHHPVLEGFAQDGRSAILQGWIDPARARVLVTSGPRPTGGLAYLWDVRANHFFIEAHLEPLVQRAPPGPPVTGGIFSLDLVGDGTPETVVLYRSAGGAPAALVLESRAGEFRARSTDPLLRPEDVDLERWEEGSSELGLYAPLRVDGTSLLLLELPSPAADLTTVAAYRAGGDGVLRPVRIRTPAGELPAIFQDGQDGNASRQLGVVDLDGDGSPELVAASGIRVEEGGVPSVRWQATVLGWEVDALVPRPDLEAEALDRIARATGPTSGAAAPADSTILTP
jgi:hypothetical protein